MIKNNDISKRAVCMWGVATTCFLQSLYIRVRQSQACVKCVEASLYVITITYVV